MHRREGRVQGGPRGGGASAASKSVLLHVRPCGPQANQLDHRLSTSHSRCPGITRRIVPPGTFSCFISCRTVATSISCSSGSMNGEM